MTEHYDTTPLFTTGGGPVIESDEYVGEEYEFPVVELRTDRNLVLRRVQWFAAEPGKEDRYGKPVYGGGYRWDVVNPEHDFAKDEEGEFVIDEISTRRRFILKRVKGDWRVENSGSGFMWELYRQRDDPDQPGDFSDLVHLAFVPRI